MKNNATIESLKAMRFSAMAAELERQIQDPSTYAHMGFEERVALLVDAEWNSRQNNKLARCIRDARFAEPGAAVEDIEYYEDRHLDKAQLLRFASCDFIAKSHHIIFKGASGNGKTYLACALGNAACRKLLSVRYARLPELLEELALAQAAGELKKAIKSYQKYDLPFCCGYERYAGRPRDRAARHGRLVCRSVGGSPGDAQGSGVSAG